MRTRTKVTGGALLLVGALWLLWARGPSLGVATAPGTVGGAGPSARIDRPPKFASSPETVEVPAVLQGLVVDASGAPVPGADVLAYKAPGPEALPSCGPPLRPYERTGDCDWEHSAGSLARWAQAHARDFARASTTTDGRGRFRLPREGDLPLTLWAKHGEAMGAASTGSGEGEVRVVLAPAARIRGVVLDRAGHPMGAASVSIIHRGTHLLFLLRTDPAGHFTSDPLPAGDLLIVASAQGHAPAAQAIPLLSGTAEVTLWLPTALELTGWVVRDGAPAAGLPVELQGTEGRIVLTDAAGFFRFQDLASGRYRLTCAEGEDFASQELRLMPDRQPDAVSLELFRGATLAGEVVGPDGAPVAAELRLAGGWHERQTGRSGPDGRFRIRGLPPGTWTVTVRAPGLAQPPGGISVEARRGQTTTLHLALVAERPLSGRVADPGGRPIAGAVLRADGAQGGPVTTDALGRFSLRGLSEGPHSVTVSAPGWLALTRTLPAPSDDLELRLEKGGEVRGRVLDSDGAAMSGVPVSAMEEDPDDPGAAAAQVGRSEVDGSFVLTGLAPGTYTLVARAPIPGEADPQLASARVQVAPREEAPSVTLRFEAGAPLRGQVVDPVGAPVPGATLIASIHRGSPLPEEHQAIAGADGRFTFPRLPKHGSSLTVRKRGYRDADLEVAGGDPELRVVLVPMPRLRGRVLDASGAPVQRFRVAGVDVSAPSGRFEVEARSRGPGTTRIIRGRELAPSADSPAPPDGPSEYPLTIRAPGYAVFARRVTLRGALTDLGDLHLEGGQTVEAVVVDAATGAPLAGARVSEEGEEEGVWELALNRWATSGADGRFVLTQVRPGTRTLRVTREGYLTATITLDQLSADGEVPLIPSDARILGRVLDAEGRPATSERVLLTDSAEREVVGMTADDGTFEFDGLAAGRYQLEVLTASRSYAQREVELRDAETASLELRPAP